MIKNYSYKILRKTADKLYYFDENSIWCSVENNYENYLKFYPFSNDEEYQSFNHSYSQYHRLYLLDAFNEWNDIKIRMAFKNLKEGQTVEDLKTLYSQMELKKHEKPVGLDRFIGKIEIFIERDVDNPNSKTFDFIRIFAYTTYTPEGGKRNYIKEHINKINQYVLGKLKQNAKFRSYRIPVNYLKLSNITLTEQNDIVYIFELKNGKI